MGWAGEQASAVVQGCAGVCGDGVDAGAGQGDGGARASGRSARASASSNRGVRLLGSDVSSAGRLFYRAGAGASLKPREVRTYVPA